MADSKIIELAKKIRAHAERGVAGEKINAEGLLAKLIGEHHISLEDLEKTERHHEEFKCKKGFRFLLFQTAYMVLGSTGEVFSDKRGPDRMIAVCTPAEKLEIEAAFAFFETAFEADIEIFKSAFIQKNHIFPVDMKRTDLDELSPEEKEKAKKAILMSLWLDKHHLHKQLEGPESEASR